MSEDVKTEETVELHDEQINDEIVEETLEEAAPVAKGKPDADAVTEPESIASVDKAADATKQAPVPKTKAGMISAMYGKLNSMKKGRVTSIIQKSNGRRSGSGRIRSCR